ncbi:MAG: hypothetical protein AB7R77_26300 [Ilumatobacteraceae bacterium]
MSAVFEARFAGRCRADDCPTGKIRVGEQVTYDERDQLVHASHAGVEPEPGPTVLGPREVMCPDCWTVKPCRCDD